jgi:hypothetical protein
MSLTPLGRQKTALGIDKKRHPTLAYTRICQYLAWLDVGTSTAIPVYMQTTNLFGFEVTFDDSTPVQVAARSEDEVVFPVTAIDGAAAEAAWFVLSDFESGYWLLDSEGRECADLRSFSGTLVAELAA